MTAMELVTIRKTQILLTESHQTLLTNRNNPIESKKKPIKLIRIDRSTPQPGAWSKIPTPQHLQEPRLTSGGVIPAGHSERSMKETRERRQVGKTITQIACQVPHPRIPRRDMFPMAAVAAHTGAAAEAGGDTTETVADSIGGSRSLLKILSWQHPTSEGRRARQARKERLRRGSLTND
jgi:hypothetical protein